MYSNIKIKWKSYPKSWRISVTFCLMEWKCWSCSYYQYMYWETTPKIVPCCTHPYIWGSDLGHRRSSLPWPLPIKYSLDFWALSVGIQAHVNFISIVKLYTYTFSYHAIQTNRFLLFIFLIIDDWTVKIA